MLIYLNVSDEQLDSYDFEKIEILFGDLISSSLKGFHDVHISRNACLWGLSSLELSRQHKAHLKSILQKISTRAGILSICPVLINIVFSNIEFTKSASGFELSAAYILEHGLLDRPATLVVENSIYDGGFYKLIFDFCIKNSPFNAYSLHIENGGGDTSASVFNEKIEQKRITVAIVDTDKRSPHGPCGETHKKVMGVHSKHVDCYIGNAYATLGREAENILPTECVFELASENLSFLENAHIMSTGYNDYITENFWDFFDMKRGFNGCEFLKAVKPSRGVSRHEVSCVEWWASTLRVDASDIDEVTIPSVGANLLSRFLRNGNAIALLNSIMRTKNWQNKYINYFRDILWFFCAKKRVRT